MLEAYTKVKSINFIKDEKEHEIECKAAKTNRRYYPF